MELSKITSILKELSSADSVTGNEYNVSKILEDHFKTFCDMVRVDKFGNVIGIKKGSESGKKVMITAHYDEIGFIVTSIDEDGFIRFSNMGGIDRKILPAQEVIIYGKEKVYGVIGAKPPHLLNPEDTKKAIEIKDLFIDTGMSPEEVRQVISIGDFIAFKPAFFELQSGQVSSKSFDNKCSIVAMLVAMEELSKIKHDCDVYFVATVQEEIHLTGATIASYNIAPDLAIVLDVCGGTTPDTPKEKTASCGKGPVIAKGPILDKKFTEKLIQTAKDENIPYQILIEPSYTGTEAWAVQVSRCGIPTLLISIPLKYMHTPVETINVNDVRNCGKLAARFITSFGNTDANTDNKNEPKLEECTC